MSCGFEAKERTVTEHINLHVSSLQEMGMRFAAAWKAAERGRKPARDHVTLVSLKSKPSPRT
jgi:hypothetical protein